MTLFTTVKLGIFHCFLSTLSWPFNVSARKSNSRTLSTVERGKTILPQRQRAGEHWSPVCSCSRSALKDGQSSRTTVKPFSVSDFYKSREWIYAWLADEKERAVVWKSRLPSDVCRNIEISCVSTVSPSLCDVDVRLFFGLSDLFHTCVIPRYVLFCMRYPRRYHMAEDVVILSTLVGLYQPFIDHPQANDSGYTDGRTTIIANVQSQWGLIRVLFEFV